MASDVEEIRKQLQELHDKVESIAGSQLSERDREVFDMMTRYIEAVIVLGTIGGIVFRVCLWIGGMIGVWLAIEAWIKSTAHSAWRLFQ